MCAWEVGQRPDGEHKLGHNKREWSPERCLFLDTETGQEDNDLGFYLPLRSWELCCVWRDKPKDHPKRERWFSGRTGLELVQLLDTLVTTDKTTWLWAHNLGFDLGTTRLPVHLPRMGWQWTMGVVTGDTPWMRWKKGNKSLTAVDSFSHLPTSLAKIGDRIGKPKLSMPAFDAPTAEWDVYRHRDVEILRDAVLEYMGWWDRERLGNLSVSGPASGWNVFRHTTKGLQVRINTDKDVRTWSRAAIYGGRRTSWRIGDLGKGPWVEIDIQRAHLSLCRNELIPTGVYGWVNGLTPDHGLLHSEKAGVIADCVVKTEIPRYPLLTDSGVLTPVGTFKTRLAGPELAEAAKRGELVSIGRALAVSLGRPMQEWGNWVENGLTQGLETLPPTALLAMKGWSRTVIGKWASRTSREVLRYPWPDDGWSVETGYYNDPGVPATTIYASGEARTFIRDQEGHDSFPAAYAWITSLMRCLLQRLLNKIRPEHLVACNTDSVVVHYDALHELAGGFCPTQEYTIREAVKLLEGDMYPYRLTVKHVAEEVRIRTPEHLVFGIGNTESRKVASVSSRAREVDPWVFEGDTWPGLVKQLSIGGGEGFQIIHRKVDVSRAMPLSWVDDSGWCFPPRYRLSEAGENELLPWAGPGQQVSEIGAGGPQHQGLLRLVG